MVTKSKCCSLQLLLTEKVETLRDEADGMTTVPVDMPTEAVVMTTETGNSQGQQVKNKMAAAGCL